eukprot:gene19224-6503_t
MIRLLLLPLVISAVILGADAQSVAFCGRNDDGKTCKNNGYCAQGICKPRPATPPPAGTVVCPSAAQDAKDPTLKKNCACKLSDTKKASLNALCIVTEIDQFNRDNRGKLGKCNTSYKCIYTPRLCVKGDSNMKEYCECYKVPQIFAIKDSECALPGLVNKFGICTGKSTKCEPKPTPPPTKPDTPPPTKPDTPPPTKPAKPVCNMRSEGNCVCKGLMASGFREKVTTYYMRTAPENSKCDIVTEKPLNRHHEAETLQKTSFARKELGICNKEGKCVAKPTPVLCTPSNGNACACKVEPIEDQGITYAIADSICTLSGDKGTNGICQKGQCVAKPVLCPTADQDKKSPALKQDCACKVLKEFAAADSICMTASISPKDRKVGICKEGTCVPKPTPAPTPPPTKPAKPVCNMRSEGNCVCKGLMASGFKERVTTYFMRTAPENSKCDMG